VEEGFNMWDIKVIEKGNSTIYLSADRVEVGPFYTKFRTIEPDGSYYWFWVKNDNVLKMEVEHETEVL
jgi:hypothetical protein